MEIIEALVKTQLSTTLPMQEVLIMPIGDIHNDASGNSDLEKLRRHISWGMERGAYFLGMADYVDLASPSNRQQLLGAKVYDSVYDALDAQAYKAVEQLYEIMKPTVGRWLGLLTGHHYWQFQDGDTSDCWLARKFQAPFLGDCAMIRCQFAEPQGKPRAAFTIWCHHGTGSGMTVASPLNRLERVVEYFDADVYLIGHQHKLVGAPMDRLYVNWNRKPPQVEHRTVIVACTGGWLRGYQGGSRRGGKAQGTYVEKKMLSPTALGGVVISARPREQFYATHSGKRASQYKVDLNISL